MPLKTKCFKAIFLLSPDRCDTLNIQNMEWSFGMKYFEYPDKKQCIAAISKSILHHYDMETENPTYPPLDARLENVPRNIVLLLLDGLGQNILISHLPEDSFLRRHQTDTLSSVFPPTTTAAATALETGLFPSQSGWLGWNIFWPPIGQNVALYPNTMEDGKQAADYHIGDRCLHVTTLAEKIREMAGISAFSLSEQGAKTMEDVCTAVSRLCKEEGRHFIYGYVNEPDHSLHGLGCKAEEVRQWLQEADRQLEDLQKACPDTLFILTADHGFTDVEARCLEDYPELEETLLRKPSIEPRALNLFLKPGKEAEFLRLWKATMGDSYDLYTKEQVLSQELFGPSPNHGMLEQMLGDYLAVARTPLTLFPNPSYLKFMKATHGGMTPEELTVPLILWNGMEETGNSDK